MKSQLNLQQCKLKVISDETSQTVEACQGTNKNVIKRGSPCSFPLYDADKYIPFTPTLGVEAE